MFDVLINVPKLSAVPIMNELYYILQYGNRNGSFVFRSNQLDEKEKSILSDISKKLDPTHPEQHLQELNKVFDKITGFTGIPKSESLAAVTTSEKLTSGQSGQVPEYQAHKGGISNPKQENKPLSDKGLDNLIEKNRKILQSLDVALLEPTPYSDRHADLVKRCQAGERRAQYELYQQYVKAMYLVCLRILNNEAEAEDVLQEAFLDAFSHINMFRGQSTFGVWLKQIVVNRAINHLRGRRLIIVDLEGKHFGKDKGPDIAEEEPYDETGVQLEVDRVRTAINKLPEKYRVVLSLYLFEGYNYEEIGNVLNISETTIENQYLQGKKNLLKMLNSTT
jgi:RNA polymerase sigma-70 factor (ECF subfamily)